jgi:SAM-dependent methyltransferase
MVIVYDLAATRHDRIKQFDPDWETRSSASRSPTPSSNWRRLRPGRRPVPARGAAPAPAGRSRPAPGAFEPFAGCSPSRNASGGIWLRGRVDPLPFADDAFDIVVSLEVIEFTPRPELTLRELARVLRPGGSLLVTNRVGREAPLILGRTFRPKSLIQRLQDLGLQDVILYPWQVEYDLAWAWKP